MLICQTDLEHKDSETEGKDLNENDEDSEEEDTLEEEGLTLNYDNEEEEQAEEELSPVLDDYEVLYHQGRRSGTPTKARF